MVFSPYVRYMYTGYLENDDLSSLEPSNNPALLRHPTLGTTAEQRHTLHPHTDWYIQYANWCESVVILIL